MGKACLGLWGGGGSPRKLRFRRRFPNNTPQIVSQAKYVACLLLEVLRQLCTTLSTKKQRGAQGSTTPSSPSTSATSGEITRHLPFLNEETLWGAQDISGVGGSEGHSPAWPGLEQPRARSLLSLLLPLAAQNSTGYSPAPGPLPLLGPSCCSCPTLPGLWRQQRLEDCR